MKGSGEDLFQDTPREERRSMLEANAVEVSTEKVKRHFKEDEIVQMKDEVANISIIRKDKNEEFAKKKKAHTLEVKGYTASIDENLTNIKKGFVEEEKEVFHLADHEAGLMVTYDEFGTFISSRKLRPSERQSKIIDMNQQRTGTND